MRVAVTGASGFVGRYVLPALVTRGASVVALSREPPALAQPGVEWLAMDLADPTATPLARMGHPDVLVHLAWGGLPHFRSAHHLQQELPRHVAFLDRCLGEGLASLVVAGTCLEYGMQSGELAESAVIAPVTEYGQAKARLLEHLLARRRDQPFGLAWLRLFYLYGAGQAESSLYPQLRAAIARQDPVFNMTAGDQVRDFLSVEVAATYIAEICLHHADAGTVNVCSGQPEPVLHRVRSWLRDWNAAIQLDLGQRPYPDYEPHAFWGDPSRLQALLDHHEDT